jgi:Major Facilitator Superfamily
VSGERTPAVPNRGAITATIISACIMQGVDQTIANVCLPHIQGSMSASQDQISWVLTSYIVSSAIMMPLTGWLAGRFGVKYIFLISVGGFTLASRSITSETRQKHVDAAPRSDRVLTNGALPMRGMSDGWGPNGACNRLGSLSQCSELSSVFRQPPKHKNRRWP